MASLNRKFQDGQLIDRQELVHWLTIGMRVNVPEGISTLELTKFAWKTGGVYVFGLMGHETWRVIYDP